MIFWLIFLLQKLWSTPGIPMHEFSIQKSWRQKMQRHKALQRWAFYIHLSALFGVNLLNLGFLWTPSRWTPWTTCSKDCIQSFEDPGVSERTRTCLEDCHEVDPRLLIEQRPCYGNPEPTICTTGGILWSSFKQQWLTWKLLSRLQDLEHLSAANLCWEKFRRGDIGQETAERLYLRSDHGEL